MTSGQFDARFSSQLTWSWKGFTSTLASSIYATTFAMPPSSSSLCTPSHHAVILSRLQSCCPSERIA
eukprot:3420882-Pyramimonas_sp.AAC.1